MKIASCRTTTSSCWKRRLPHAEGCIVPTAGHVLHLTHAELLAQLIGNWLLPCKPEGCTGQ